VDIVTPSTQSIQTQFPHFTTAIHITTEGFKAVFKVTNNGQVEALKLIQIPIVSHTKDDEEVHRQESLARALREVEALELFKAPEIVKLGTLEPSFVTLDGHEYLAYTEEFLHGNNLGSLITAGGTPPDENELKQLLLSLTKAIEDMWNNEFIHRDIKPLNVIKTGNPERPFVLLDLGVAFSVHGERLTTNPEAKPGTLLYMAPEEFDVDYTDRIDHRFDLYSAALTTYEYATRVHPLKKNDGVARTVSRILHQDPLPLKSLRSDLSEEFCDLIDQFLKKKPANRPGSFPQIYKILEQ
jgi:serine/threonine protein kinase